MSGLPERVVRRRKRKRWRSDRCHCGHGGAHGGRPAVVIVEGAQGVAEGTGVVRLRHVRGKNGRWWAQDCGGLFAFLPFSSAVLKPNLG